jgi:hypothetical protein
MEYARMRLPALPPGSVTAETDSVGADQAMCIADADGKVATRFTAGYTTAVHTRRTKPAAA